MRGVPTECEYGTTKSDRGFIEQSDLIEQLRMKVKKLEQKLSDYHSTPQGAIQGFRNAPNESSTTSVAAGSVANNAIEARERDDRCGRFLTLTIPRRPG